ncbi:hypothetical protein LY78DRAFT_663692, partial [Colletotrichum sublineola]
MYRIGIFQYPLACACTWQYTPPSLPVVFSSQHLSSPYLPTYLPTYLHHDGLSICRYNTNKESPIPYLAGLYYLDLLSSNSLAYLSTRKIRRIGAYCSYSSLAVPPSRLSPTSRKRAT